MGVSVLSLVALLLSMATVIGGDPPNFYEPLEMFRLKAGDENIYADDDLLLSFKNKIKLAVKKDSVAIASAITDYLAAVTNVSDEHLKVEVSSRIVVSLELSSCPRWDLDFKEIVNYQLCDCSHITTRDWQRMIDKGEFTSAYLASESQRTDTQLDDTMHDLTVNLFKTALRDIHRCNSVFAWPLLGLLFVQHGLQAGMHVFKSQHFGLFYDALEYTKTHANATKEVLFLHMMDSIEEHLHPGEAELQFHKMDLIVKSLNAMQKYSQDEWLDRLQAAMNEQEQLGKATNQGRHLPPKDPITGDHVLNGFFVFLLVIFLLIVSFKIAQYYYYRIFPPYPLTNSPTPTMDTVV